MHSVMFVCVLKSKYLKITIMILHSPVEIRIGQSKF